MSVTFDLPPQTIEQIAQRVAEILSESASTDRADRWLDARSAAEHLGCSTGRIYKLVERREIPFVQDGPGCKLSFSRRALDQWMEDRRAR